MGLGNQMFQYAAGRALSLYKNVPFKIDISSYEGYSLRKFELDTFFAISPCRATKEEVSNYQITQPLKSAWNRLFPSDKMRFYTCPYEETGIKRTILKVNELLSPAHTKKTYLEPDYHFSEDFFRTPDDVFLIGFWMSWRYFKVFDKEIRQDFTIRPELVRHLIDIEKEIIKNNSVSIHIRRTDFTTQKNSSLHGVIPIEFYNKAIDEISNKMPSPHFYVFSDDVTWAKENLHSSFPITFVSGDVTSTAVEDFYLMTVCKHNIIANSTFSWWAAYLNSNSGKMIIAPEKWYNTSPFNYKDVYPLSWLILNS